MVKQAKLTDEEIQMLREFIRERQYGPAIPTRVEFDRDDATVKSIRISERMVDAAIKKAGLNFNRLIEMLVWQYLGCDTTYTAKRGGDNE
jgi:hypothetical protein